MKSNLASSSLLIDLYELSMAAGYFKLGMEKREAVFHYFFRRAPFSGSFAITAGLESLIDYIENFRFSSEDLSYLRSLTNGEGNRLFDEPFLSFLKTVRLDAEIDAIAEGTVVFPYEPIVRVKGSLLVAQLLETPILTLLNYPTLIATKAARMHIAAEGEPILEFGMRRAQGVDGGITASRSAYIGGATATSNLLAGKLFGIPVRGTLAHSWILSFDDELEAFRSFAEACPHQTIFLVDTFDSLEGVKKAIQVGHELKKHGLTLKGIRLDSGDLAFLSIKAKELLDAAGFQESQIVASNELDEFLISELKRQGAKITHWGIGTKLVTGGNQGALDGVYKLSAIRSKQSSEWQYKIKLSEQLSKISNPGYLQVLRYSDGTKPVADLIYDEWIGLGKEPILSDPLDPTKTTKLAPHLKATPLLQPIFRNGSKVYELPSLEEIRKKTLTNLELFPSETKQLVNPDSFPVGFEQSYQAHKLHLIQTIRNKEQDPS